METRKKLERDSHEPSKMVSSDEKMFVSWIIPLSACNVLISAIIVVTSKVSS
jgi:hypothetical protein